MKYPWRTVEQIKQVIASPGTGAIIVENLGPEEVAVCFGDEERYSMEAGTAMYITYDNEAAPIGVKSDCATGNFQVVR